ncbi:hypothetical protein [Brucella intermedia]|uniref:hypothetical protein n=1 Tax=Brucella intermedia TaxID=94625 RepID=UPI00046A03DA|nr:hypothetical protein [Brucella intermedia]
MKTFIRVCIRTAFFLLSFSWFISASHGQAIVFDPLNAIENEKIINNTESIIEKNASILSTVNKTLKAVTGERRADAATAKNAAHGKGFSTSDAPTTAQAATEDALEKILETLKTEFTITGKTDEETKQPILEAEAKSTLDMNALIKGIVAATKARKKALEATSNKIGDTKDVKGSLDQNSQIQLQNGVILNEIVGMNNQILSSNQMQQRRRVTDVLNSMKAMSYNE